MSLQTKTGRRKPVVSPSGFVCIFSFVLFSVYLFQQLVYRSFQLCVFPFTTVSGELATLISGSNCEFSR